MAKTKKNRKKSIVSRAARKPKGKTRAHRKFSTSSASNRVRGLNSARARLIPESEPERTLSAGQSGDVQGLSKIEDAESESVEKLAEEGQDYEAELVSGIERAAGRPGKEVHSDVSEEDRPRPKRRTL